MLWYDLMATDCVLGLGSNLGDRRATLVAAVRELEALGRVVGVSALYETDPVGPPQPDYLNAAVRLHTATSPEALLAELLAIERRHGRVRRERWGPRCLDLDILWIVGSCVRMPELEVPHPELERRPFALLPLLDVAPGAAPPEGGPGYAALASRLDISGVRRLPGSEAGAWAEPRGRGQSPDPRAG